MAFKVLNPTSETTLLYCPKCFEHVELQVGSFGKQTMYRLVCSMDPGHLSVMESSIHDAALTWLRSRMPWPEWSFDRRLSEKMA